MKQYTHEHEHPITCPHCGTGLDASTGVTGNNPDMRPPKVNDISVCSSCGEIARFGEDLQLSKIEDEELMKEILKDEQIRFIQFMVKARKHADNPEKRKGYAHQLELMAKQLREWRAANPDTEPSIQYNFQEKVGVVGTFKDAVDNGFVSINDDARDMFNDLGWLTDCDTMPTMNMVRAVIEHVFDGGEGKRF